MALLIKKSIIYNIIFLTIALALYADEQIEIKNNVNTTANINELKKISHKKTHPHTTFIVFIAGDNDLFPFAGRNIKQMQTIGSNERLTIFIHFDMHRPGQPKLTKRFLVEKNKLVQVGPDAAMDSGDIQTLISCCECAIKNYPADEYILVIWNHGTGVYEPKLKHAINPSQLFRYNPNTKLIELDRSIGFMDFISQTSNAQQDVRGICFDDTNQNYLTNQKLKDALHVITKNFMSGGKFSVIAFDACLMAMIEVASIVKDYAHIMCASEDVELGTGLDYASVLSPYLTHSPDRVSFAKHLVESYHKTYSKITNDYTHSAIDLSYISLIEEHVEKLAKSFIYGLQQQKNRSVIEAIRLSSHKNNCTLFDEPAYKDFGHFCKNALNNMSKFELKTPGETAAYRQNLSEILKSIISLIEKAVIANTVGKNLENATGLAICLPQYQMHSSYKKAEFAIKTGWLNFIMNYLAS